MLPLLIVVSPDDIAKAKGRGNCPLTLAIRRLTGASIVIVGLRSVWIHPTGLYRLPPITTEFLRAFDRGAKVQPFFFEAIPDAADLKIA